MPAHTARRVTTAYHIEGHGLADAARAIPVDSPTASARTAFWIGLFEAHALCLESRHVATNCFAQQDVVALDDVLGPHRVILLGQLSWRLAPGKEQHGVNEPGPGPLVFRRYCLWQFENLFQFGPGETSQSRTIIGKHQAQCGLEQVAQGQPRSQSREFAAVRCLQDVVVEHEPVTAFRELPGGGGEVTVHHVEREPADQLL